MAIRPELIAGLTSGPGAEALAGIGPEDLADPLALQERLRRSLPPDLAAAVAETARLRLRAAAKFGDPTRMLFTDAGLQQATPEAVAEHRAARFGAADLIVDLGTGIGGDAMRLVRRAPVVGIDVDRTALVLARHNVADERFLPVRADATTLPPVPSAHVFADPARRTGSGLRRLDPAAHSPPLALVVDRWIRPAPGGAVKTAPGIAEADLPAGSEAEFVSLDGDLRECTLWFGALRTGASRVATLLPGGHRLARDGDEQPLPVRDVGAWLHEPDPAVIRASLVGDLAARLGLAGIDSTIAYLTGDDEVASPFLASFRVEAVMPFNLKRIKSHLRGIGAGELVVKKRGSAVDPDDLRRRLRVPGTERRVLFVTRAADRPVAIVATRR